MTLLLFGCSCVDVAQLDDRVYVPHTEELDEKCRAAFQQVDCEPEVLAKSVIFSRLRCIVPCARPAATRATSQILGP